jgi:glutathione S-transferase
MALDVYWSSGCAYSWRVLLALEYKELAYHSHLVQLSKQQQQSTAFLALNFRGRVPVVKDGDYVVFESLAALYYLDLKYPTPRLFGDSAEEAGVIMRVICEYQSYVEPHVNKLLDAFFSAQQSHILEDLVQSMHAVANEARSIEMRLAKSAWIVGEKPSAADLVIFPALQCLLRALGKQGARELSARFLPLGTHYPALAAWSARVMQLPGYERTFPPHWR